MIKAEILKRLLAGNRPTHAYLLVGKSVLAAERLFDHLARSLGISAFDQHVIREDSSVSIATIRNLRGRVSLKPHSSPYHLVFFPTAETMTTEAQNALLKILEEPPSPTIFILFAPDCRTVLPTIASRCQRIQLTEESPPIDLPPELSDLAGESLSRLFLLAEKLAKNPDLTLVLDSWVMALRSRLRQGEKSVARAIGDILAVKAKIKETQANRRLLLENLFLTIKYPQWMPPFLPPLSLSGPALTKSRLFRGMS